MKIYLKKWCFLILGFLTFFFSNIQVNATTKGFNFFTFKENGKHKWKIETSNVSPVLVSPGGYFTSNGTTAYCIEPGITYLDVADGSYTVHTNTSQFSQMTGLSEEVLHKLELISYYGYGYNGDKSDENYMATQMLIWNTISPKSVKIISGEQSVINSKINTITKNVENALERPSFSYKTVEVVLGEETSIIDTKNVLNGFKVSNCQNCQATIEDNTLKVTATSMENVKVTLTKSISNTSVGSILYTAGTYQKLMTFGDPDDTEAILTLKVNGGKVELHKLDKDKKVAVASGEATLNGAVYGVYSTNDEKLATLTTDEYGYAISDYLPYLGNYYLQEEKASNGYTLDNTKYYFELTDDYLLASVDVYEKVIENEIELTKVYATDKTQIMKPEVGIKFGFYNSNGEEVAIQTTDSNGKIKFNLPYGSYVVKQLSTTIGHEKVKDFKIDVKTNGEKFTYTISNAETTARIKVIKVDQDNNYIKLSGIKFKIKDLETNQYICQTISYPDSKTICEYETNSSGILITPYPLGTGNYQLEETDQFIDGYTWNSNPITFSINDTSNIINSDGFDAIIEIRFKNNEVKGNIEIQKIGEELIIENNSYEYIEIPLENVHFGLYDKNDILIQEVFTNSNGYAIFENLKLGTYYLKELSSSNGNILDSNKYEITLKYKDQYTPIVSEVFTLKNYLPKGELEFTKTDLVTGDPLPNTKVQIYTNNTNEENILVFEGITDSNGKIIIKNLFTGKFKLVESEAPKGYTLNSNPIEFEILEDGQIIKADMTNEAIVDVPNTGLNDSKILDIAGIILIVLGVGYIVYQKKKEK